MKKATEQKNSFTVLEGFFPVVDVKKFSKTDRFLEYTPESREEKWLKDNILEAMRRNISSFRVCNTVISEENGNIVITGSGKPAVGHHIVWWNERMKFICPEKNSRIGDDLQYAVYLGTIIKILVKTRVCKNVKAAWKTVCSDSRVIKIVYPFGDLTQTGKIFKKYGTQELWLAKGCRNIHNDRFNLAERIRVFAFNGNFSDAIPFIVMDE